MRWHIRRELVCDHLSKELQGIGGGSLEAVRGQGDVQYSRGGGENLERRRSPDYRDASVSYLEQLRGVGEKGHGGDSSWGEGSIREDDIAGSPPV